MSIYRESVASRLGWGVWAIAIVILLSQLAMLGSFWGAVSPRSLVLTFSSVLLIGLGLILWCVRGRRRILIPLLAVLLALTNLYLFRARDGTHVLQVATRFRSMMSELRLASASGSVRRLNLWVKNWEASRNDYLAWFPSETTRFEKLEARWAERVMESARLTVPRDLEGYRTECESIIEESPERVRAQLRAAFEKHTPTFEREWVAREIPRMTDSLNSIMDPAPILDHVNLLQTVAERSQSEDRVLAQISDLRRVATQKWISAVESECEALKRQEDPQAALHDLELLVNQLEPTPVFSSIVEKSSETKLHLEFRIQLDQFMESNDQFLSKGDFQEALSQATKFYDERKDQAHAFGLEKDVDQVVGKYAFFVRLHELVRGLRMNKIFVVSLIVVSLITLTVDGRKRTHRRHRKHGGDSASSHSSATADSKTSAQAFSSNVAKLNKAFRDFRLLSEGSEVPFLKLKLPQDTSVEQPAPNLPHDVPDSSSFRTAFNESLLEGLNPISDVLDEVEAQPDVLDTDKLHPTIIASSAIRRGPHLTRLHLLRSELRRKFPCEDVDEAKQIDCLIAFVIEDTQGWGEIVRDLARQREDLLQIQSQLSQQIASGSFGRVARSEIPAVLEVNRLATFSEWCKVVEPGALHAEIGRMAEAASSDQDSVRAALQLNAAMICYLNGDYRRAQALLPDHLTSDAKSVAVDRLHKLSRIPEEQAAVAGEVAQATARLLAPSQSAACQHALTVVSGRIDKIGLSTILLYDRMRATKVSLERLVHRRAQLRALKRAEDELVEQQNELVEYGFKRDQLVLEPVEYPSTLDTFEREILESTKVLDEVIRGLEDQ